MKQKKGFFSTKANNVSGAAFLNDTSLIPDE
jgi:hypothetical protein